MRFRRTVVAMVSLAALAGTVGTAYAAPPDTSTEPSSQGNPADARAQANGVCPDAHQIGSTAIMTGDGDFLPDDVVVATVRQFYSPACNERYGFVWVDDDFHKKSEPYELTIQIHDVTAHQFGLGIVDVLDTKEQEFWSTGVVYNGDCTTADGSMAENGAWSGFGVETQEVC